jgi:adenylate cyclase
MARERVRRAAAKPAIRCATCGKALRPTHKFCPGCGAPAPSGAGVALPLLPIASGPSLQVGAHEIAALEEQRKVVTVMFADLSGSTPLAEKLDPEELRGILASYFGALAREIQQFGGTIDKYIGDAVMAVWGAPVSREDDALRAVGAGLQMQAAITRENERLERRYGVRLSLRIGINTGEVVAGLLAGDVQQAYTVVGDAVNTAQRLESVAPLNTVLVGESTYLLARRAFRFEAVPPVTLKGKSEPVPAYRAIGLDLGATAHEGPAFVGRLAELDRLKGILAAATSGHGQLVHLHGEAGVGKTRLVEEFTAGLGAAGRLHARCLAFESARPYALIADLLRRTFQVPPTDTEADARAQLAAGMRELALAAEEGAVTLSLEILGYGERSPLDPQRKRQLLVSLLRRLLEHRSTPGPAVLVIEDVHWIDAASSSLLTDVVAIADRLGCLVITTSRDVTPVFAGSATLAVEPLASDAAAAMVEQLGGEGLLPATRSLVLERTAGNPFFIEEVLRALRAGRSATVPATVQDVLEARLDALTIGVRHVAQRAAVVGRTFRDRVLAEISRDEPLRPALATLEAEAFIVRAGNGAEPRHAFRHALLQEVSYQTLLLTQRRQLHAAVGQAFEHLYADRLEEFVDVLAYHYGRSEEDAKARYWSLRAGQRAQRLFARDEALAYYRQAVERAADDAGTRAAACEGIGDVERLAGKWAEALTAYDDAFAARDDGEAVERARLLRKKGVLSLHRGDPAGALAFFERAAGDLPADAAGERARILLDTGEVQWRRGEYDTAVATLSEAAGSAERAGDEAGRAEVLKQLGTVQVMKGDKTASLASYEESLRLYTRVDDLVGQANVLNNMGLVLQRQGRNDEALEAHERASAIRERIGDEMGIAQSRQNAGEVHRARGQLDQAEAGYRAALDAWERIGYVGVGLARSSLGVTEIEKGNAVAAREHLRRALDELAKTGNRSYLLDTRRHLARSYLLDDPAKARELAHEALEAARELKAPDKEGLALQILGLACEALGDGPSAIDALERSRDLLRVTAERQELGRTLAGLGRLYAKLPAEDPRGRQAVGTLAEARGIFTELGAALELRRMGTAPG